MLINAKDYKPSEVIKFMRENKGLKQAELGRKIRKSKSTIQKYEYGEASCSFTTLVDIANICDVEIIFKSKDKASIKAKEKSNLVR